MAPKLQRINAEDFGDAPDWFRQFLDVLNPFLGDTTRAFSNNNTMKQIETFRIDTLSTLAATFAGNAVQLKNKLPGKPVEIRVGQVFCRTAGDSITSATSVQWDLLQNGLIRISYITGLNVSKSYDVTLIVE
jgi:hypothetical protein